VSDALLTASDVAELLSVPVSWVRAETRADRMPHVTLGRYRRYRRETIEAWVADAERGPIRSATGRSSASRSGSRAHGTADGTGIAA
jgi:excisionase family DNA binding protein